MYIFDPKVSSVVEQNGAIALRIQEVIGLPVPISANRQIRFPLPRDNRAHSYSPMDELQRQQARGSF
jgi:hypothetical protein